MNTLALNWKIDVELNNKSNQDNQKRTHFNTISSVTTHETRRERTEKKELDYTLFRISVVWSQCLSFSWFYAVVFFLCVLNELTVLCIEYVKQRDGQPYSALFHTCFTHTRNRMHAHTVIDNSWLSSTNFSLNNPPTTIRNQQFIWKWNEKPFFFLR